MRKLRILALTLALLVGAGSAGADIISFGNNTYVQAYRYNSVSYQTDLGTPASYSNPPWWDRIGKEVDFETYGGNFDTDTKILTINTNWGGATPGNNYTVLNAIAADLFVDTDGNGSFDKAIALSSKKYNDPTTNSGRYQNIYVVGDSSTYHTSQDVFGGNGVFGGAYYGGRYNINNPTPVPVWANSTTALGTAAVSWTSGSDPQSVTVDLSGILPSNIGDHSFSILWATGTCANDTAEATFGYHAVPLPPSVLLLAIGLLGLAGLRKRSRKS